MPSARFTSKAPIPAALKRAIAVGIATKIGSAPDAMGLLRFCGCLLSRSRSQISLTRYTPPLARQKYVNATKDFAKNSKFKRFCEKKSGANTNAFFTHSWGRSEANNRRKYPPYEVEVR